ncbi:importin-7-like [Corticium candelabrum]|uniref:importin-7-like n=1 Tax=Corticium candelabrum TaxID=121492 RepID=UPI002E25E16A|nr:importin-7-like [Corticium candelabrum]
MDYKQLGELLAATLNPQMRQTAELKLRGITEVQGFTPCLLQVVMSTDIAMPVRQAGSIYLKNTVTKHWKERDQSDLQYADSAPFLLHTADKMIMRANIVEAIIHAPEIIRVQLLLCLEFMVRFDYPQVWSEDLLSKVHKYLLEDNYPSCLGACLVLHRIIKKYEYRPAEENRKDIDKPIIHFFPILMQLFQRVMPDESSQSVTVQKQILKLFCSVIQFHLHRSFATLEVFPRWMQIFVTVIERPVPQVALEADEDIRGKLPWWKCKRYALQIVCRIFERYGMPGNVTKEYHKFADYYVKNFSVPVMQTMLRLLDKYRSGHWLSSRVLHHAFNYIATGVGIASSWKVLKPNIQVILQEVVFPLMCYTDDDDALWQEDPYEYIKIKFDVYEEFISPVAAAALFLNQATKKRKDVLKPLMLFCHSVLNQPSHQVDPRKKDGVLNIVGSIAEVLMKKQPFKNDVEGMLQTYVLPDFQSAHGFLRARACSVINYFSPLEFEKKELLVQLVNAVRVCLTRDEELPVRVQAAVALQSLLHCQDEVYDHVEPHVTDIMTALLTVIRETENDDLTDVLEELIKQYAVQVSPYATELATQLCETFIQLVDVSREEPSDDDAYKAVTAMGILSSLQTLITAVHDNEHMMEALESPCGGVCVLILQHSIADFYEEILGLIGQLTAQKVSRAMWQVFALIHQCFATDGFEYFVEMVPCLHNYITVDTPGFLSNPSNVQAVYQMCEKILQEESGEDPQCHACKLLEVVLLQCRGHVDNFLPQIVKVALERVTKEVKTFLCRAMCLQVVVTALYCNPALVLDVLHKLTMPLTGEPVIGQFFTQWFQQANTVRGIHNRKVGILTIIALLSSGSSSLPPVIAERIHQILPAALNLFSGLEKAYKERAKREAEAESEEDDLEDNNEDDDVEVELDSDEDDIDDEGTDYVEHLATQAGKHLDDEDNNDDDDDEDIELDFYETPLDNEEIDEYANFKATLLGLQAQDTALYSALTSQLTEDQQKLLQEVMEVADRKASARESARLAAQGGYQFSHAIPTAFNFG